MALALLEPDGASGSSVSFRADLGSNRYYAYAIGPGKSAARAGGKVLAEPTFKSKLLGPLSAQAKGHIRVQVPSKHFDRESPYIQLYTFRDQDLAGPAFSKPVRVWPLLGPGTDDHAPPPLTLSRDLAMSSEDGSLAHLPVMNLALDYREAPLAHSMFLNVLTSLIPKIAGPLLGGLLGGASKPAGKAVGDTLGNPEVQKLLTSLLQQLASAKSTAQSLGTRSLSTYQAVVSAQSASPRYTTAQIAPALLAAMPALMPVLEKALNPETIKAITDGVSPNKLAGMVIDGMKDFAKLGLQADKQMFDHLEKINPGVDDAGLDKLLAGMALNLRRDETPSYRRVSSVKLSIPGLVMTRIEGKRRVAYVHGRDLVVPLELTIKQAKGGKARRIPEARILILVKDPATLKILARKTLVIENVGSGSLETPPRLSTQDLTALKPNEEYLVCATLTWKSRKGERIGTSRSQLISLVGRSVFDRVEGGETVVPLSDAARYRSFWHKVWQATFTKELARVTWNCRYLVTLEPDQDTIGRLKTSTRIDDHKLRHDVGRLKTGMVLTPLALNKLLPQLGKYEMLDEDALEALTSTEFAKRFNQSARASIEVGAKAGQAGALWVYPEVQLQQVILRVPANIDQSGQVHAFEERAVTFPIPTALHLLSVSPGSDSDGDSVAPGGMAVKTDRRVALYPVDLVRTDDQAGSDS